MMFFATEIGHALGDGFSPGVRVDETGEGALPSVFRVTDLATTCFAAAGQELAALQGAAQVTVDRRLASFWFDMTLRPSGWQLPSVWDDIAGDYATADGWIRLHTNAPHHRNAALAALDCEGTRDAVTKAVRGWNRTDLETAVVAQGGCAAAMHDAAHWSAHPQGQAVSKEPLIAWTTRGRIAATPCSDLSGLRVLDLTRILAGPVATRFLAGFGADVLRIDPPGWSEPAAEPEVTLGKRCAGLDLRRNSDRATFRDLLAQADVLVHGYRADALENLGFGARERNAVNPGCIDISLNAYGWTGPWTNRRGFDSLVQMSSGIAASGMMSAHAAQPVPLPVQALDHATGYLMAAAALRGVRIRAATGDVMSAKLSLARTAHLLMQAGPQTDTAALMPETPADQAPDTENTIWGPARRIKFPLTAGEARPHWRYPAGPLHTASAKWELTQ